MELVWPISRIKTVATRDTKERTVQTEVYQYSVRKRTKIWTEGLSCKWVLYVRSELLCSVRTASGIEDRVPFSQDLQSPQVGQNRLSTYLAWVPLVHPPESPGPPEIGLSHSQAQLV